MTYTRRGFLAATGAMLSATALGAAPTHVLEIEGPAFGAGWKIRIAAGADTDAIITAVTGIVSSVDAAMSPFQPTSEISRFNRLQTEDWVSLSAESLTTIAEGKRIAVLTQGAFDPTLGGIVGRYGFGPITQEPAGSFEGLSLNLMGAKKSDLLQTLDLCGIAKGHALDRIATALIALGHNDFFVELGGEVFAHGNNPEGRKWRAGVESPLPGSLAFLHTVVVAGEALATSGDRTNSFVYRSNRYSHIIDPQRRLPADSGLASVSVFAPRAVTADALATALFAMGPEQGAEFAEREQIPALFVFRDGDGLREDTTADFSTRIIA